ncbi:MAG: hypothetical protein KC978_21450, partial [Candidatus Omnitrophica bacterium]|nr:hypothetical protein [Candidatus Omnitrophota bacterium]
MFPGGGADYAEWFEWADGNPDNEDRCGMSVTLVGNKIALAQDGDELLGVISGNASVVGDGDIGRWKDKYLRDDFGRYLTEEYTVTQWVVSVDEGETISYESDRIPDDVIVPIEAEVISVDDYGNALTRRVLNPAYNPDA